MTPSEAHAILGIDPGTDKKSARRAYLRKVREHKPEQDPDGFQRVREAWELLERRLTDSRTVPAGPRDSRTVPAGPRDSGADPSHRDAPWAPPERRVPPRPPMEAAVFRPADAPPAAHDVPEPADDPGSEPEEAPETGEPEPDPPVSTAPSEPEGVPEPEPWGAREDPDARAFTLDDGPRIVPDPAPWAADDAVPDDPAAWQVDPLPERFEGPDPDILVQQALEAADIDGEIALDALTRACDDALNGRLPEPPVSTVLQVVLALHRAGDAHNARSAWRVASRWMDATGAGIRIANQMAVWLAMARELSDLPSHFPTVVRARIARAALDQDPTAAQSDLLELYRSQPHIALDAADLLEAYAPNLHKLFGRFLRDPAGNAAPPPGRQEPPKGSSGINPMVLVYVAIVLITIVLRVVLGGGGSSSPPPRFEPVYIPPPPMPVFEIDPEMFTFERPVQIGLPVLALCLEGFGHPKAACKAARAVETALEKGDCARIRTAMAELEAIEAAPPAAPAGDLSSDLMDTAAQVRQISKVVTRQCPADEEPPRDP